MKHKKHVRRIIQIVASIPLVVVALAGQSWIWTGLILLTALAGAFYCGYLCPFGLVQELAIDLRKKLKIKPLKVSATVDRNMKYIRYILFILFSVFSLKFIMEILKYDPRSHLHIILTGKAITLVGLISIGVFFAISVFVDRFYCRYLCLKGASYGLLSKLRLVSIVRNESSCVNCKKCDRVCQMNICVSKVDHVDSMACINCFECIKACPIKNTLEFKPVAKKHLRLRIALLSLIFLGYFTYTQTIKLASDTNLAQAFSQSESTDEVLSSSTEQKNVELVYVNGTGEGYNGEITVKVGFDGQQIVGIEVVDHQEDYEWYVEAKKPIIEAIKDKQSTDVEVVSGATYSSVGIIEAVEDAIQKHNTN